MLLDTKCLGVVIETRLNLTKQQIVDMIQPLLIVEGCVT